MAPPIRLSLDERDQNRPLLAVALLGVATALVLAIFGLPGADLHGPLHRAGIMDPFCGGTRALRLAARGDIAGSLWWNPLSLILLAGALAFLVRTAVGLTLHRWLNATVVWSDRRLWLVLGFVALALEARQQSMREVLMRPGY
ncbi:MAG TPA: DUF2752 domain-containing protein [Acidimicrobiales bacterium]|nr:DUF2752 domain-containing protein [Acidimicrobiales bacterium]